MSSQIISIVKRAMGFMLCICLAGLFTLLMTWMIIELRADTPTAQKLVFGTAVNPRIGEQYVSWETMTRVDKVWRDEYVQNEMSLRSEFDSYGDEQAQQIMDAADSRGYATEK